VAAAESQHYTFDRLGDGIHAAIARPEGDAVCNSGLLDLGEGVVVFDTGLTPGSAQDLRRAAERRFKRPPGLIVNSHWHLDHTCGNQSFPKVPIWGTRRTREILLEKRPQLEAELQKEKLEADLKELKEKRPAMKTAGQNEDLDLWIRLQEALLASNEPIHLTPPDHTFESRLALPGPSGAELLSFGSAHTEADAFLFLPREKILFAGDVITLRLQPSMGSGDPEHWLEVLNELERLRPERIVPGHGVVSPVDAIEDARAYLAAVLKAASARKGASLPAAIRKWEGSLGLEENLRFAREWVKKRRTAP
jgi:cyclase